MGEIIEIQEKRENFYFRIRFTVTGEERIVSIDQKKREIFCLQDITQIRPMACPFLRETVNKKFVCSVHGSRPDLCRQYSCYRILIMDVEERKIGKVTDGSHYFLTSDETLRTLWNDKIAKVAITNEKDWEEYVEQTLVTAGYRVLR
jgi:uncharacterized protein